MDDDVSVKLVQNDLNEIYSDIAKMDNSTNREALLHTIRKKINEAQSTIEDFNLEEEAPKKYKEFMQTLSDYLKLAQNKVNPTYSKKDLLPEEPVDDENSYEEPHMQNFGQDDDDDDDDDEDDYNDDVKVSKEAEEDLNAVLRTAEEVSEKLKEAVRKTDQIFEQGQGISQELRQQTEQLQQIDKEMDELGNGLNRAKKELRRFALKELLSKCIIVTVLVVVIIGVILIILKLATGESVSKPNSFKTD